MFVLVRAQKCFPRAFLLKHRRFLTSRSRLPPWGEWGPGGVEEGEAGEEPIRDGRRARLHDSGACAAGQMGCGATRA